MMETCFPVEVVGVGLFDALRLQNATHQDPVATYERSNKFNRYDQHCMHDHPSWHDDGGFLLIDQHC